MASNSLSRNPWTAQASPDPAAVQHYRYRYHAIYGSPVIDNVTAQVSSVAVDGPRVTITLLELVASKICELNIRGLRSTDGPDLLHTTAYYTLNKLRLKPHWALIEEQHLFEAGQQALTSSIVEVSPCGVQIQLRCFEPYCVYE